MPSPALSVVNDYAGDPKKLFSELKEKAAEAQRIRSLKERDWYIAREFYRGNQYVAWNDQRGVVDLPNTTKKARLINNKVRPSVDTVLSYLLRQDPTFSVTANTGEPEDQAAVMTGRSVLYHYWHLLNCPDKVWTTGLYTFVMAKGFWKITWDPLAGRKIPIMQKQEMAPDPMMLEEMLSQGLPYEPQYKDVQVGEQIEGDVRIDVVSPFEFLNDPMAATFDEMQFAIHYTRQPVDYIRALVPDKADKIKPDDPDAASASYARAALQGFGAGGAAQIAKDKANRVTTYEYWGKPTKEHPNGLRVLMTKDEILQAGPTPSGHDSIPFAEWEDQRVPGEFWGDAMIRDAIPLQKEHNKRFSQWANFLNTYKNYWTAPIGSLSEDQLTNEDNQLLEHQPGQPPQAHAPPPFSTSAMEMLTFSAEAIENVTGALGVLQGNAKGEVRSGRQVAYQGQYAEGRINLKAKAFGRFLSRAGHLILQLVSENVTEPRIAKVVGRNRTMEVKAFKGADLRGQTDVTVDADTLLSFSKSERFNMLKEMLQNQVITPEEFRDRMDIGDFQGMLEDVAQDRNNAQRENEAWRNSQQTQPPRGFENHKVHLQSHNYFRKSDQYRMLDPMMQQFVDQHCAVHEQFIVGPQMQQPMGPDGPGGPPPDGGDMGPNTKAPFQPPPTPAEMNGYVDKAMQQSGQELAEGLPPVPPVADIGPEHQH